MEHPIHKERLRELVLLILEKRMLREDVTRECKYATGKIKSGTDISQ